MELLCIEYEHEPRGYLDPVFIDDERILRNLLHTEERYIITCSYFKCFQTELQSYMRQIVCSWMLEVSYSVLFCSGVNSVESSKTFATCAQVCEAEMCQEEVFPLSMNIMDRFLSVVRIRKSQLQLLGAVCLFLASKIRQTRPISAQKLVKYTDDSITCEELVVSG